MDINKQKAGLEQFQAESQPILIDFAERLEYANSSSLLEQKEHLMEFVILVAEFMRDQDVDEETRVWITVRIGYLLGEYFAARYEGYWGVNERVDSPQYGHYVIFAPAPSLEHKAYPIAVFEAANEFVHQAPERDLVSMIEEIEQLIK